MPWRRRGVVVASVVPSVVPSRRWPVVPFATLAAGDRWAFSIGPFGSRVTTADYRDSGVPFIRGVNITRGRFLDAEFVFISAEKAAEVTSSTALPGDLVFTRKGTVGQVSMIPRNPRYERYVISGSQVKARVDQRRAWPEFYYYWFRSPAGRRSILAHAVTTGVPSLASSLESIRGLAVPCPPLAEQRAVAEVLGALDDRIAVVERLAATSRELGEARFAAAVAAPGGHLVRLGDVVETLTRGVVPRYTEDVDGLAVLNQRCVRAGRVSPRLARRTDLARVPPGKYLRAGDVLVNSTGAGTLGRVARWAAAGPATVDAHLTIARFAPRRLDPMCGAFAMLAAQPEIAALGEGSTGQTELGRAALADLRLAVPAPGLRASVGAALGVLESCGEAALREGAVLAELRDTLLPGLMSGDVRVRDAAHDGVPDGGA